MEQSSNDAPHGQLRRGPRSSLAVRPDMSHRARHCIGVCPIWPPIGRALLSATYAILVGEAGLQRPVGRLQQSSSRIRGRRSRLLVARTGTLTDYSECRGTRRQPHGRVGVTRSLPPVCAEARAQAFAASGHPISVCGGHGPVRAPGQHPGAERLRAGRRARGVVARDRPRRHRTQKDPVMGPKGGTAGQGQTSRR
jgi:hypothetical protein